VAWPFGAGRTRRVTVSEAKGVWKIERSFYFADSAAAAAFIPARFLGSALYRCGGFTRA
jgi:hypothetical protein